LNNKFGLEAALILVLGAAWAVPVAMAAPAPFLDAHVHMDDKDPAASAERLVQSMAALGELQVVIQTLPYGPGDPDVWDLEKVQAVVARYPRQLALTGGGGSLNPMLVEAYATRDSGPEARQRLRDRAEAILRQGAVGFGELSNEHLVLPGGGVKDYEYYPADSPLMLLLADIAAAHGVPIDLHMEAVPQDTPSGLPPPNAPMLHANIQALERLLDHNRRAKIIWAHAGADNVGFRTPELMARLLQAHPNLYMEIKVDPVSPGKIAPLADGRLKPDWLALFSRFPDRFIVGSDQHYDAAAAASLSRTRAALALLDQLPPALRQRIAVDNPRRLYNLLQ
jgi:predicted TIM-barrel fold metal-dependent hydrolase